MSIEPILDKGKEFEFLVSTYDPAYNDLVTAISLVKDFIIDNELIVYGGSAIDYALRLRGDKIYPDDLLKIPDLDFYSPNSIEHSYQLADILYRHGYKEVRAINAQHIETMRVDLKDNHFIADITYRPSEIFNTLPYLIYNKMRIIHPDFQRLDVHSSLSYPYDNVPREVIFERWSKDIKRFNKLAGLYPMDSMSESVTLRNVSVRNIKKYVLAGFAAYAIIYREFTNFAKNWDFNIPSDIIGANFYVNADDIVFETLEQQCEIVHFDANKAASELSLTNVKKFEPFINLMPARIEGNSNTPITIYSTHHRLLAANSVKIDETILRITNIQFVLKMFLAKYFLNKNNKIGAVFLSRYNSLLKMIGIIETELDKKSEETRKNVILSSIFFPTMNTYGNENINLARGVALNRLYHDLDNIPLLKVPPNYYPDRCAARNSGYPKIILNDIVFFRENGREIN